MTEPKYEVGYRRPPKAHQFVKGRSGNSLGSRRRPTSTLASSIEEIWMRTVSVPVSDEYRSLSVFELILLQLTRKWSAGTKKAFKIYLKYHAFAATKPAVRYQEPLSAEYYELLLGGYENDTDVAKQLADLPKMRNRKPARLLTDEERARQQREHRLQRIRAGLEEPTIEKGMSAREAGEMYDLFLKMPPRPRVPLNGKRRRKKKMEASEIFEQVAYGTVKVTGGSNASVSRVVAAVKTLAANAAKGDLNSADLLIDIHTHSLKHGDFAGGLKILPR
jgi:hypothetical protein